MPPCPRDPNVAPRRPRAHPTRSGQRAGARLRCAWFGGVRRGSRTATKEDEMAARVAINGLGRTGRATPRPVLEEPALELDAASGAAPAANVAYLLRYDTAYGRFGEPVEARDSRLTVGARTIHALREEDPAQLPWRDLGVELVFECTGVFRTGDALRRHLEAGARRVVL